MPENWDWALPGLAGFVPGTRMSHYLLEEQIGAGGMAVVFRARDENLDRTVALKILAQAMAADQGFRQRFIRESRAAAAVDDPHIVPVYEASEASGVLFIAMRYVRSGSVSDLLQQHGPMPPDRVAAIISPIASALDAAHRAGLVHRDVKPGNILVDTQPDRPDHVYLADFGLTKGTQGSVGLTGTNQILGTPSYMSPEQVEGREVTGRSDQYALACTAFEMLTGQTPFHRDQGIAVLWAHLNQAVPSLASLRPELMTRADPAFGRGLAKAQQNRYVTCREFADALRGAFDISPYHSSPGSQRASGYPQQPKTPRVARQAPVASADPTHDLPGRARADMPADATPPHVQAPPIPADYQQRSASPPYQPTPYRPPGFPAPGYSPQLAPAPQRPFHYPPITTRWWVVVAYLLPIVIFGYGLAIVPFLLFKRDRSIRMSIVICLETYVILACAIVFGGIAFANKGSAIVPLFAVFSVTCGCVSLIFLVIAIIQLSRRRQPNIPVISAIACRVAYGKRNKYQFAGQRAAEDTER